MDQAPLSGNETAQVLADADQRLAACSDVLERQVVLGTCRSLDEETVARVGALIGDLAGQLAGADQALIAPVQTMLAGNRAILAHCHALSIEWRLAMALGAHHAIDPVVPPLVQSHAPTMMALMAAQSRSFEGLRRMRLDLHDLPADLQNLARAIVRAARADHAVGHEAHAENRLDLLHQAVAGLGADIDQALRVEQAGISLFFTALAIASGHPRESVVLAAAEDDPIRLALLLRAAGLSKDKAVKQLLILRPDADPALVAHDAYHAETLLESGR